MEEEKFLMFKKKHERNVQQLKQEAQEHGRKVRKYQRILDSLVFSMSSDFESDSESDSEKKDDEFVKAPWVNDDGSTAKYPGVIVGETTENQNESVKTWNKQNPGKVGYIILFEDRTWTIIPKDGKIKYSSESFEIPDFDLGKEMLNQNILLSEDSDSEWSADSDDESSDQSDEEFKVGHKEVNCLIQGLERTIKYSNLRAKYKEVAEKRRKDTYCVINTPQVYITKSDRKSQRPSVFNPSSSKKKPMNYGDKDVIFIE